MIAPRPLLLALGVAVGGSLVAGCGTFSNAAATVDGNDISVEDFEALLADVGDAGLGDLQPDEATGTIDAEGARTLLGLMIRDDATTRFLDDAGQSVTDADRDTVLADVDPAQLENLSDDLRRLLVDTSAVTETVTRVEAPTEEELRESYETWPVSTGLLCLSHILVATEHEAREILEELAEGADFAALASEHSTDEVSAANGGALGMDEQACTDVGTARQSLDPQFLAGAFDARAGVPTGPVESQFGWHVILARPFDEVSDSVAAAYESNAGALALAGALATADVSVDPRYGAWDASMGNVVGLG